MTIAYNTIYHTDCVSFMREMDFKMASNFSRKISFIAKSSFKEINLLRLLILFLFKQFGNRHIQSPRYFLQTD
jgi:hypothetical protein